MSDYSEKNDRSNLGVIPDSTVHMRPGAGYNKYLSKSDCTLQSKWNGKSVLSIGEVKELWKEIHGAASLREMEANPNKKKIYLHELLINSEVLLPKLQIPERNPELEKRVAALKNYLADKEYQRMTQNVSNSSHHNHNPEDTIGFQSKG